MCAFTPSNVHLRNRKCDICRSKCDTMTKNWKLFVFPQHHKQQLSINCFFETQLSCILWALALYRTQLKWQGIIRCLLRSWKQVMARPWAPFWWCAARRRPLGRAVAVAALILWALDSCSLNRKPRCIKTVHLNIHLTCPQSFHWRKRLYVLFPVFPHVFPFLLYHSSNAYMWFSSPCVQRSF